MGSPGGQNALTPLLCPERSKGLVTRNLGSGRSREEFLRVPVPTGPASWPVSVGPSSQDGDAGPGLYVGVGECGVCALAAGVGPLCMPPFWALGRPGSTGPRALSPGNTYGNFVKDRCPSSTLASSCRMSEGEAQAQACLKRLLKSGRFQHAVRTGGHYVDE